MIQLGNSGAQTCKVCMHIRSAHLTTWQQVTETSFSTRRGIQAGESSTGYANRAMASLKLGEVADAEVDCTRALALDPNYLKAWQRRAAARAASGRLLDAIDDLESALRCVTC